MHYPNDDRSDRSSVFDAVDCVYDGDLIAFGAGGSETASSSIRRVDVMR